MRKQMSHGFSLVELIVVMVILGILVSTAIFKLSTSDEGAYLSTMKSDARNVIALENSLYASYQTFGNPDTNPVANNSNKALAKSLKWTGISPDGTTPGDDLGTHTLTVSPYNTVDIQAAKCDTLGGSANEIGYQVTVTNPKVTKEVIFNSCTMGGIEVQ